MDWWFWMALGALLGWWVAPCVDGRQMSELVKLRTATSALARRIEVAEKAERSMALERDMWRRRAEQAEANLASLGHEHEWKPMEVRANAAQANIAYPQYTPILKCWCGATRKER